MSREIITISKSVAMVLFKILEVEPICKICGCKITEKNFDGLYNKPIIAICDSLLCLTELCDMLKKE